MGHSFREEKFNGSEGIQIILFLRSFRDAADHNDVSEGAAAHILPYFLEGPAASRCKTQMTRLASSNVPLYPALVNGLLHRYATEHVMSEAYQKVHSLRQNDGENELQFGGRLLETALQSGDVFDERDLKSIFMDGLETAVRPLVRQHAAKDLEFESLQELAFNTGESLRTTSKVASVRARAGTRFVPSPRQVSGPRSTPVANMETSDALAMMGHDPEQFSNPESGSEGTWDSIYNEALPEECLSVGPQGQVWTPPSSNSVPRYYTPRSRSPTPAAGPPTYNVGYPGYPRAVAAVPQGTQPQMATVPSVPWAGSIQGPSSARNGPNNARVDPSTLSVNGPCFLCYRPGHVVANCPVLGFVPEQERSQLLARRAAYIRSSRPNNEGRAMHVPQRARPYMHGMTPPMGGTVPIAGQPHVAVFQEDAQTSRQFVGPSHVTSSVHVESVGSHTSNEDAASVAENEQGSA